MRESFRINEDGVRAVLAAYGVEKPVSRPDRPVTMDMVLTGSNGGAGPEFKFPSHDRRIGKDDLLLFGLEIAGPGGHWVEFSRPICAGTPSPETLSAMDAYHEYFEAAKQTMREGVDAELRANIVVSMHPHAITADESMCLYMQDTWLVTKDGGVPFSQVPLKIYAPGESLDG